MHFTQNYLFTEFLEVYVFIDLGFPVSAWRIISDNEKQSNRNLQKVQLER